MPKRLQVDLAFFDQDRLLCQTLVVCSTQRTQSSVASDSGHVFEIHHQYEDKSCPLEISCHYDDQQLYKAALRIGVHTSDDWESISLGDIHELCFYCRIL